jgi:hypothetical protein
MPALVIDELEEYYSAREGETEYHLGGRKLSGWRCGSGEDIRLKHLARGQRGSLCQRCAAEQQRRLRN